MGCSTSDSFPSLLCALGRSLIFPVTRSASVCGDNSTKHCQLWFPHCVSFRLIRSFCSSYCPQERRYFVSKKELFCGGSWNTPATFNGALLSSLTTCPTTSSFPNRFLAID